MFVNKTLQSIVQLSFYPLLMSYPILLATLIPISETLVPSFLLSKFLDKLKSSVTIIVYILPLLQQSCIPSGHDIGQCMVSHHPRKSANQPTGMHLSITSCVVLDPSNLSCRCWHDWVAALDFSCGGV